MNYHVSYLGYPVCVWQFFLVLVYALIHNKDEDVTCMSISSLVIYAYNILVKKKFHKFYVLSIGTSTAKMKEKVNATVHKRTNTLCSQRFKKNYKEIKMA